MDFSWFLRELVGEAASIKCGFPQTGNGKHSQWPSDTWRLPSLAWTKGRTNNEDRDIRK